MQPDQLWTKKKTLKTHLGIHILRDGAPYLPPAQPRCILAITRFADDPRSNDLPVSLVGHRDRGRLADERVRRECVFDLHGEQILCYYGLV